MSESDEQIRVFQVLALNEARYPFLKWIHASMSGASASSQAAAALRKRQGQKPGISDICIPIPTKNFHGAFIELKAGKNKCTPEQVEFMEFAQDRGYAVTVRWGADDALTFIEDYLDIRLRGFSR